MKPYLISLGVGLFVGIVYSLFGVRSPAPPVIALVGLLGILAGEQIVPTVKRLLASEQVTIGWIRRELVPHVFGHLPVGESRTAKAREDATADPL